MVVTAAGTGMEGEPGGGLIKPHLRDDNGFSALRRHGARYSYSDLGLRPLEYGIEKTHQGLNRWSAIERLKGLG
jgi:hypothetical protein